MPVPATRWQQPRGLWLALLLQPPRGLGSKQNKTKNLQTTKKTCPLLAMLRYVFFGLLTRQKPVRAGGPQLLLFPEFYVVAFPLRMEA